MPRCATPHSASSAAWASSQCLTRQGHAGWRGPPAAAVTRRLPPHQHSTPRFANPRLPRCPAARPLLCALQIVHVMADWAGRRAARKALTATSTANLLSQSQLASDEPTELAHPRGSDSAGGSSAAVAPAQQLLQVDGASARSAAISQPAGGAGDLEAVGGEDAAEGPALVPDVDVPKDALQVCV